MPQPAPADKKPANTDPVAFHPKLGLFSHQDATGVDGFAMNFGLRSREVVPAELHGDGRFVLSREHFVPPVVRRSSVNNAVDCGVGSGSDSWSALSTAVNISIH